MSVPQLVGIIVDREFLEKPTRNRKTIFKVGETQIDGRELNLREAKSWEERGAKKKCSEEGLHDG
jgi:hypothetical protein